MAVCDLLRPRQPVGNLRVLGSRPDRLSGHGSEGNRKLPEEAAPLPLVGDPKEGILALAASLETPPSAFLAGLLLGSPLDGPGELKSIVSENCS